jgi:hypothetical protein
MMHNNWSGYVMDGSPGHIASIHNAPGFWRHDLRAGSAFITRDNIEALLDRSGFDRDLGILSIDLDGMDYWIAERLRMWKPRILIMEYNAVSGGDRPITVPYKEDFRREEAHFSMLYFGASLPALCHLTRAWGYELVGTVQSGVNAFFVRSDLINTTVRPVSVDEAFTMSRHEAGRLSFIRGADRGELISGLPVFNVVTGAMEIL